MSESHSSRYMRAVMTMTDMRWWSIETKPRSPLAEIRGYQESDAPEMEAKLYHEYEQL